MTFEEQHRALYHRWISQQLEVSDDDSPALVEARLIDLNVRLRERLVGMDFSADRLNSEFAALDAVTRDISRVIHGIDEVLPAAAPVSPPPPVRVGKSPAAPRKSRRGLMVAGLVGLVLVVLFSTGALNRLFGSGEDAKNAARIVTFAPNIQLVRGFPDIEPFQAWTQADVARLIVVRRDVQQKTGFIRLGTHGIGGVNQKVAVSVAGKEVKTFETGGKTIAVEVDFPWPSDGREAVVEVKVDPLVQPSSAGSPDTRRLGVAVQGGGTR